MFFDGSKSYIALDNSASSITALKYAKNFCKKVHEMSVVHIVNDESIIEQLQKRFGN